MRRSAWQFALPAALLFVLLALTGCATFSENFSGVERRLAAADVTGALAAVDRVDFPARDQALYLLNKGMLQRMAGDLRASAGSFEAAKALLDEFTKLSLREQSLSLVVNDASRAYEGQPFERILLHVFAALNYLELGDLDGARVEALQLDVRLQGLDEQDAHMRAQSAFARYLTGLIYEARGERADAMIAYRKAYDAYLARAGEGAAEGADGSSAAAGDEAARRWVPAPLRQDLLRLTEALGLRDEHRRYARAFGVPVAPAAPAAPTGPAGPTGELGEVVFVFHNGLVPGLREQAATVLDPASGHFVRLALPALAARPPPVASAVLATGSIREPAVVVEDVAALARRSLDARLPGMTARLLARQVVKRQVSRQATKAANNPNNSGEQLGGALLALGVELTNLLTERADTRSWATLPANIQLVRLPLPPGRYALQIDYLDAYNQVVATRNLPAIDLAAGRKVFLSDHRVAGLRPVP